MIRYFIVSLLCLYISAYSSSAQGGEKHSEPCTNCWDGSQGQHFILSGITGVIVSDVFKDRPKWQQFGIAMIPGTIKELGDKKPSSKDMFANILGSLSGLYLGPIMIQKSRDTVKVSMVMQW